MVRAVAEGALTIEKPAMTCVCSVGLDMTPARGYSAETIADHRR